MMKTIPAMAEDSLAISALQKERILGSKGDSQEILNDIKDENMLVLKLTDEENIFGFSILRLEGEEAEIDEIAISESIQSKGFGSQLLCDSLSALTEKGAKTVFLEVRKKNIRAIRLYERNGFTSYRTRKNYYGDDDAICYKKEVIKNER